MSYNVWLIAQCRFQFHKRSQLFICSHDAVIRIYDDAGNVIRCNCESERYKRPIGSCRFSRDCSLPKESGGIEDETQLGANVDERRDYRRK